MIGAGGAGLRAAIAAHDAGARTAIVCKSLLGKAHTVMAEGGIAAAMGNLWPEDNWEVHFRDTMRGGKLLNHWRMAQLHAQEAPDRVWELEAWGALFDRTEDGKISQRDFGGHRYARLAHVGDRTGLEMIRTLQQRAVALGIDVFMECTITALLTDDDRWRRRDRRRLRLLARDRQVHQLPRPVGRARDRRHRPVVQGHQQLVGVLRRRPRARAEGRRHAGQHGVRPVPPHRDGLAAVGRGILVTESVRGDGGILKNSDGKRFMFDYIPEFFKAETADTEEEADRWYEDKKNNRRPPELLPRDEVARAINSEVKAGRGSPHGGVFLDIASRRTRGVHQQAAAVDVPPVQGAGRRRHHRRADGGRADLPLRDGRRRGRGRHRGVAGDRALRRRRVAGGMHGANRLGGNSLSDLLVFGKRAGEAAAAYATSLGAAAPELDADASRRAEQAALAPFLIGGGENPYTIHHELQQSMNDLVGIIRTADEIEPRWTR